MLADLPFKSLVALSRLLRDGDTTSVAIVEACLANIDARDGKLHAFVEIYRDDALAMAEAADLERRAGFARGPLHGLPIAIKDLFHIEGRQTTAGAKSWLGRRSSETATCVRRLLDAGMIPLGKTHMVEFAFGTWGTNQPMGTPWNPADLEVHRVAGGSSSGSAVAVAAGMAPVALGTDTGGSVRIPAALCGLVGLKPTYGRIPLEGVVPLAGSLDSVGPLARTIEDAALLAAVMAGEPLPHIDGHASLEGARITAMAAEQFPDGIEPAIVAAYDATIARLGRLGARMETLAIPFDFADLGVRNGWITGVEGYAQHRAAIDDPSIEVDPGVRGRMAFARKASAVDYLEALAHRRSRMSAFDAWMRGRDALLTPMLPITARRVTEVDEMATPLATWSRAVNYLGACAATLPAQAADSGLPIGMQIIAPGGADARLERIARAAAW